MSPANTCKQGIFLMVVKVDYKLLYHTMGHSSSIISCRLTLTLLGYYCGVSCQYMQTGNISHGNKGRLQVIMSHNVSLEVQ